MPYNYFCCRQHTPPVTYAAEQPKGLPGVFASPLCPTCKRTMEWYSSGDGEVAPSVPPNAPPAPPFVVGTKPKAVKIPIYNGSGKNPGHPDVTWEIYKMGLFGDILIQLHLGKCQAGTWDSSQKFAMSHDLLTVPQAGPEKDWWLSAPDNRYANRATWHEINLRSLCGQSKPAVLPDILEIGVKLGNSYFGLIHLLAGHAASVRATGPYKVDAEGTGADSYRTIVLLGAGMQRFKFDSILKITYDPTLDKMLIKGSHSGLIVLQRQGNGARFSITTMFNMGDPISGNVIYER